MTPPNTIAIEELGPLFDALPDVVFFVKDREGRYLHANLTLVRRLGLTDRTQLIGRHATDLFPSPLGRSFALQDQRVLRGACIEHQLEVHIFGNRTAGWCLTHKRPLRRAGSVQGVIGISRDLGQPDGRHPAFARVRRVMLHLQSRYAEPQRIGDLARMADMSVAQLERYFQRVFQLTPRQMLTKLRIDGAIERLRGPDSIGAIGQACGFADQSAFARQFKAVIGMPPRDYRRLVAPEPD